MKLFICLVAALPAVMMTSMSGSESSRKPLPSDPNHAVRQALEFAICTADGRNGMDFASRLIDDTSRITYTTQITKGVTYRFYDVVLLTTDCPPQTCENIDTSHCGLNEVDHRQICELSIQVAKWEPNPYTVINTNCNPVAVN